MKDGQRLCGTWRVALPTHQLHVVREAGHQQVLEVVDQEDPGRHLQEKSRFIRSIKRSQLRWSIVRLHLVRVQKGVSSICQLSRPKQSPPSIRDQQLLPMSGDALAESFRIV